MIGLAAGRYLYSSEYLRASQSSLPPLAPSPLPHLEQSEDSTPTHLLAYMIVGGRFAYSLSASAAHVEHGVSFALHEMQALPGQVEHLFADAGSWLLNAGEQLLEGLWKGVEGETGKVLHDMEDTGKKVLKYLTHHQLRAPSILAALAQSVHDLTPPDALTPVVRKLAHEFVHPGVGAEVVAAGLNSIREVCRRQPWAMEEDLLGDLIEYRKSRDKAVVAAARGLLQLFREVNPGMLKRRERVRPVSLRSCVRSVLMDLVFV